MRHLPAVLAMITQADPPDGATFSHRPAGQQHEGKPIASHEGFCFLPVAVAIALTPRENDTWPRNYRSREEAGKTASDKVIRLCRLHRHSTVYVIVLILFAFWAIRETIRISLKQDSRPRAALFTGLYYSFGINGAFEVNSGAANLDNFQAFFFALGVLGTGTGNIVAHRQLILGFQAAQMAADLILIGVAVVLAVNRLTPARDSSASTEGSPPQETRQFPEAPQGTDAWGQRPPTDGPSYQSDLAPGRHPSHGRAPRSGR